MLTTILFILLCILQVNDVGTTYYALRKGYAREANPVMRWLFDRIGLVAGLLLPKIALMGLIVVMWYGAVVVRWLAAIFDLLAWRWLPPALLLEQTWRAATTITLCVLCAFYVWVVWRNFELLLKKGG